MSRVRANQFTDKAGTGSPTFTKGAIITGVATATSFSGDISGNSITSGTIAAARVATLNQNTTGTAAGLTGTPTITVGNITAVDGSFSGNVSIAQTLTYEDVKNVDSVGLITARSGLLVGPSTGIGATINSNGNANFAGVVTATTFKGDGDFVELDVDGHTNLDNVSIAGIVTATTFSLGDGSATTDRISIGDSDSNDLALYHNGSHSFVVDRGTGNLYIRGGDDVRIEKYVNDTTGEPMIVANADGAVELYWDASKKIETTNTGVLISGIATATQLSVGPGVLAENFHNDTGGGMQSNYSHDILTYGMVWYGSTNAAGSWTFNVRGNGSTTFNSLINIGQTTTMTMYSANNNTSNYMTAFKIDGTTITVKWAGGSAPSAATGSGTDVYSMTIMKTADATFTVFGNFTNFA